MSPERPEQVTDVLTAEVLAISILPDHLPGSVPGGRLNAAEDGSQRLEDGTALVRLHSGSIRSGSTTSSNPRAEAIPSTSAAWTVMRGRDDWLESRLRPQ